MRGDSVLTVKRYSSRSVVIRWSPDVTAGAAISRLVASTAGAPFGTESKNNLGWTFGLGVEFVIAGPWTAKAEYLYADLNGLSCNVACGGGPISINVRENIVRAGLNYRIWALKISRF